MNYGRVYRGEVITLSVPTHKFETGEKEDSVVTGYYLKMGADFRSKVAITFDLITGEEGLYYKNLDTSGLDEGMYFVVIKATVDTIHAQTTGVFEVLKTIGRYGVTEYGNSRYY